MTELEEYEVHDINLAAYLECAGCVMQRTRRQGQRVYFIFTNVGGPVKDLRDAFFTGKGIVKAYEYSQRLKALKELCHG